MLRLNIRHELPQIGLRIQHSQVNQAHDNQATISGRTRQAESRKWITQPRTDIESYQSRHAYGHSTMLDFARENGQRGLSDVQNAISEKAQRSWSFIDNGSKASSDPVVNMAESDRQAEIMEQRYLVAAAIPDPTTTLEAASEIIGDIEPAETNIEFDVPRFPTIDITTGSVETYIQNQGFLRQWTTQDHFDIYA